MRARLEHLARWRVRARAASHLADTALRPEQPLTVAVGALAATSGYRILDQSAGRLAAHGDREQVLPGGDVSADLARVDEGFKRRGTHTPVC